MNTNPDNKNKIMTYMILFIALVESAAIYGLIISFQMLDSDTLI
jgi:F0F1-type ATP synthase membrane subunit c/vacuolar-type H+-ATPase subunit K